MNLSANIFFFWHGSNNDDFFYGGPQSNRAYGHGGDDFMSLGAGDDTGYGGSGDDVMLGGDGDDNLYSGSGDDLLFGGIGNDWLNSGEGNDHLFGGDGNDIMLSSVGDDYLDGGLGNDIMFGGNGHDVMLGGLGNDTAYGGNGNDRFLGGAGQDDYDGGADWDILDFSQASDQVRVQLQFGRGFWNDSQGDTYVNIEEVIGSNFNDVLDGDDGGNILRGGAGRDNMDGNGGTDHLFGGTNGAFPVGDLMSGGSGADVFYFEIGDSGGTTTKDVITDFGNGVDLIAIDADAATFLGEQNGFQGDAGAQVYVDHVYSNMFASWMTELTYRDDTGSEADIEIQFIGIIEIEESDIFIY